MVRERSRRKRASTSLRIPVLSRRRYPFSRLLISLRKPSLDPIRAPYIRAVLKGCHLHPFRGGRDAGSIPDDEKWVREKKVPEHLFRPEEERRETGAGEKVRSAFLT